MKTEILPYCKSLLHLNGQKLADNNVYLHMVENVLATPGFYFSYSYDLTHSIQRLHDINPEFWQQSLVERADYRCSFFFKLIQFEIKFILGHLIDLYGTSIY